MDSPLHDADDPEFADPHAGYEPVARHLKVLSASGLAAASPYFYRYTRCVTGSNQNVNGHGLWGGE